MSWHHHEISYIANTVLFSSLCKWDDSNIVLYHSVNFCIYKKIPLYWIWFQSWFTHWKLTKMIAVPQAAFSNTFPSIKSFVFWFKFHWSFFPRVQFTNFANPRMYMFPIPQCSIQNRNVHIYVLHGALWDMEQGQPGICELGQLARSRH